MQSTRKWFLKKIQTVYFFLVHLHIHYIIQPLYTWNITDIYYTFQSIIYCIIFLFGVLGPILDFLLMWRCQHYRCYKFWPILSTHRHRHWAGRVLLWHIGTCDTHKCTRAFDSRAVTTYFNDLRLSRSEIEPLFSACKANSQPLSHRGHYIELF